MKLIETHSLSKNFGGVQALLDIHPEYNDGLTIGDEIVIPAAKEKHDTVLQPVYVKKDK